MSKTLADVAFDAFATCHSEGPRERWQAAADAVVNRYIVVRSTADRALLDDKEQAVIEAARNLVHGWRWTTDSGEEITVPPWDYYSQDLLTEKLRALDSEEG